MTSAGTMSDRDRDSHYRVGRGRDEAPRAEDTALRLPFGAWGIALIGALALGLFGLVMPTAWLETVSFQLYLDQITSAALPPLGATAHIAAALFLGLIGAALGWLLGRLFGVQPSGFSLHGLINRLRGVGEGDEADAPTLRSADRHPDAPARRPFSAARDIPERGDYYADQAGDGLDWDDGEEDALLLDGQFAPVDEGALPPAPPLGAKPGTSFDEVWARLPEEPSAPPVAPAADTFASHVTAPMARDVPIMPQPSQIEEDLDAASLPAPSLDDWEREAVPPVAQPSISQASAPLAPSFDAVPPPPARPATMAPPAPVVEAAPVTVAAPAPAPVAPPPLRAGLPPVEPLDLSAARLDDLLSRLESGLGRRGGPVPAAPTAAALAGVTGVPAEPVGRSIPSPRAEQAQPCEAPRAEASTPLHDQAPVATSAPAATPYDPAFPHDPALAAALKTLRRLNQKAMA